MKRILIPSVMILALAFLSACGSSGPQVAPVHWHDLYPMGILTEEERESRAEMKETVSASLPPDMQGKITCVSLHSQCVEVSISYSDERVQNAPEDWAETVEDIRGVSEQLREDLQEGNDRPTVLYVRDAKKILLTVMDGDLLYNRFKKAERPKQREIAPEILEKIEAESIARIKASGEYDRIMSEEPSTGGGTVYVSNNRIIHSIPNCSGMSSYTEMGKGEADSRGYKYCENCW